MQQDLPVGPITHYYGPDDFDKDLDPNEDHPWVYRALGKGQDSLGQRAYTDAVSKHLQDLLIMEYAAYRTRGARNEYPDPFEMCKVSVIFYCFNATSDCGCSNFSGTHS